MKIKYNACMWNPYAKDQFPEHTKPDSQIVKIDENTISIDGQEYSFDSDSVLWPNIAIETNYLFTDAKRIDGELHLEVRRFYSTDTGDWDTGDYHAI